MDSGLACFAVITKYYNPVVKKAEIDFSHSSGGWEVQDQKSHWFSVRALFWACTLLPSCNPLTRPCMQKEQKERERVILFLLLIRYYCPHI